MRQLYESQRVMRNMRRSAMQRGVVAIIDVGTFKVACLMLRFDGRERRSEVDGVSSMAGQSAFRVVGAACTQSRGVRLGEIETMNETERAIRTAVQSAQKMAKVRADHAIACFSGATPRSFGLTGTVNLTDIEVTEHDLARVLAACEVPDEAAEAEVLHAQPVNFALDYRTGLSDPRGQMGKRLACDMHLLAVDPDPVRNLVHCIKRCDMELSGIASSAYASGLSCLVEDERELGAACVDMGGGVTSISVFMKKHMIYADSVPIGGDYVSQDIAMGLKIPATTAERIKTFSGGVVAIGKDDRQMISLADGSGDREKDDRVVSRSELIGIIRPRIEEILEEVRKRLDIAGFEQLPSQQIVLTGGASLITGLQDLAPRILGNQVRIGMPLRVRGLPQAASGPAFSSSVGLCLFAAHPQDEWWDFQSPTELRARKPLSRAVRWVRENW